MTGAFEQDVRSFVIFRIGDEEYGLAIDQVRSIIRNETATPVPRSPEVVMGVINLRGQVIPVIDMARRFGREPFVPTSTSRIVVADGEAGMVGIAVDAANEVVAIPVSDIKPAPDGVLSADTADAFEGVAERNGSLVILIDLDRAVPRAEYARSTGDSEPEGD